MHTRTDTPVYASACVRACVCACARVRPGKHVLWVVLYFHPETGGCLTMGAMTSRAAGASVSHRSIATRAVSASGRWRVPRRRASASGTAASCRTGTAQSC
jgi:hypothetical protein